MIPRPWRHISRLLWTDIDQGNPPNLCWRRFPAKTYPHLTIDDNYVLWIVSLKCGQLTEIRQFRFSLSISLATSDLTSFVTDDLWSFSVMKEWQIIGVWEGWTQPTENNSFSVWEKASIHRLFWGQWWYAEQQCFPLELELSQAIEVVPKVTISALGQFRPKWGSKKDNLRILTEFWQMSTLDLGDWTQLLAALSGRSGDTSLFKQWKHRSTLLLTDG